MSDLGSQRPLYRPLQPTPEQREQIDALVERLGSSSDEASGFEVPSDPAAPTSS